MTKILIEEAIPGMVLTEDVFLKDTSVLVMNKGAILDERKIERLKELEIYTIEVLSDREKESVKIIEESFKPTYNKMKAQLNMHFDNLRLGKKESSREVVEISKDMLEVLSQNHNLMALLRQMEDDDDYLYRHSIAVGMMSAMLSKWMNYDLRFQIEASIGGTFHDIGKIKVPPQILNKPAKLTEYEFSIMKEHSSHGYYILKDQVWATPRIKLGVLQHHERNDGSGYPQGRKKEEISSLARIIAVCDVFDAISSQRAYQDKRSPFEAAEIIFRESANLLDTEYAYVLLKKLSTFYVGNMVSLNNGEVGEIVYLNPQETTRPLVRIEDRFVDLASERHLKIMEILE